MIVSVEEKSSKPRFGSLALSKYYSFNMQHAYNYQQIDPPPQKFGPNFAVLLIPTVPIEYV